VALKEGLKVKKFLISAAMVFSVLSLAGCTLFYPNWGATELPTTTPSSSASETPTPSATPSPSETASATPTPTTRIDADVQVLDASADATAGTITVIAQVNNVTESGGSCIALVKDAGVTKTYPAVSAESNAASTQCFPITIALNGLASGTAAVQVSYSSSTAVGKSNFFAVTIP
jgi:hypothetical protein